MSELFNKSKTILAKFVERYGWTGFLALPVYPVVALAAAPVRWAQTLWQCRWLAAGKWREYTHFFPHMGLICLFYWTQAVNLSRFGRNGRSPLVGLGHFFLGNWWHLSLLSVYAYWQCGAVVNLLGMGGWWLSHLLWLDQGARDPGLVLLLMALTLLSTTFYANTFALQNYNVLGWIFAPLGLYGWATGHWWLAALAWLAAAYASFTVVFLGGLLSLGASLQASSLLPVLTMLPAGLKLLTHFWPFAEVGNLGKSLVLTLISMGTLGGRARYKYQLKLDITHFYYLLLYSQFLAVCWWTTGSFPLLLFLGLLIYLNNSALLRFSDEQNMYMLLLSLASAQMFSLPKPGWPLLASYWLAISPIPLLAGFLWKPCLLVPPVYAPFEITPILRDMADFLKPVPAGARVLMAFDDPGDAYEKIFDGYRVLLEAPQHVAAVRGVHFMPDWWAVREINYAGAPHFWGREVGQVQRQMAEWQADAVVIYQAAGTEIEPQWQQAGFEILSYFSWAKYEDIFGPKKPYLGPTPAWWLLKKA